MAVSQTLLDVMTSLQEQLECRAELPNVGNFNRYGPQVP